MSRTARRPKSTADIPTLLDWTAPCDTSTRLWCVTFRFLGSGSAATTSRRRLLSALEHLSSISHTYLPLLHCARPQSWLSSCMVTTYGRVTGGLLMVITLDHWPCWGQPGDCKHICMETQTQRLFLFCTVHLQRRWCDSVTIISLFIVIIIIIIS